MDYPDKFIRRVVATVTIIATAYLLWEIRSVVMIVFGGMIIATLLNSLENSIARWSPLRRKFNFGLTLITVIFGVVGIVWWIGGNVSGQFKELGETLPRAVDATKEWLTQFPIVANFIDQGSELENTKLPWQQVMGYTGTALGAIGNVVLIFTVGVYLAATPEVYHRGLLSVIPPVYRQHADTAFIAAAKGLKQWLIAQLITMIIVGTLVAIGLSFLKIPLALSLGLIAGLFEFIPFFGPFAFGALAILLAFTEGPTAALNVAILTLLIQQLEGNVISPLIQRRAVKLPPVLGLIGVLIFGSLFGVFGVLFATPLTIVAMILIKRLYIKNGLEPQISIASN